ncbi:hypothetical protein G039_0313910 [Pseudomonas aeruginosa VRFPA01]|nr:hypothetical protein G039_0313910 [Pseudomonas aeruginosa VRFPA01]
MSAERNGCVRALTGRRPRAQTTEGGDLRGNQAEIEDHVADHCQQGGVDVLDARGARTFTRLSKE